MDPSANALAKASLQGDSRIIEPNTTPGASVGLNLGGAWGRCMIGFSNRLPALGKSVLQHDLVRQQGSLFQRYQSQYHKLLYH